MSINVAGFGFGVKRAWGGWLLHGFFNVGFYVEGGVEGGEFFFAPGLPLFDAGVELFLRVVHGGGIFAIDEVFEGAGGVVAVTVGGFDAIADSVEQDFIVIEEGSEVGCGAFVVEGPKLVDGDVAD